MGNNSTREPEPNIEVFNQLPEDTHLKISEFLPGKTLSDAIDYETYGVEYTSETDIGFIFNFKKKLKRLTCQRQPKPGEIGDIWGNGGLLSNFEKALLEKEFEEYPFFSFNNDNICELLEIWKNNIQWKEGTTPERKQLILEELDLSKNKIDISEISHFAQFGLDNIDEGYTFPGYDKMLYLYRSFDYSPKYIAGVEINLPEHLTPEEKREYLILLHLHTMSPAERRLRLKSSKYKELFIDNAHESLKRRGELDNYGKLKRAYNYLKYVARLSHREMKIDVDGKNPYKITFKIAANVSQTQKLPPRLRF